MPFAKEYIESHNDHNFQHANNDYLCISKRHKNYFDSLFLDDDKGATITFLSGEAGSGKSLTLYHEYTRKFELHGIKTFQFNFTPDKHVKNHYFLTNIVDQILSFLKEAETNDPHMEKLSNLQDMITNDSISPFNYQDFYKEFVALLSKLCARQRIAIIFEDVHLSKKSFKDFIDQISRLKKGLKLQVFCTTRYSAHEHNFQSSKNHKWFYLEQFSKTALKKYLPILMRRHGYLEVSNQNLLDLSGGNPFYINELYMLNKQRLDVDPSTKSNYATFSSNVADGKLSIINLRYSYLSDKQKQILEILSVIGFNVALNEVDQLLDFFGIKDIRSELDALQDCGFIKINDDFVHFRHHLVYEGVKFSLEKVERARLNRAIFFFLRKTKNLSTYERLVYHAYEASLFGYACYYSKKVADILYQDSAYDLAYQYYNNYLQWIDSCSDKNNNSHRVIEVLSPLHASCLILGKGMQAENIATYLKNISEDVSPDQKFKIYSALTTSHWTIGNLSIARDFAKKNIEIAQMTGIGANKVSAYARYGTLCMDVGSFNQAIDMHKSSLSYIKINEKNNKFGMFVEAYPCSISIQSTCLAELGNNQESTRLTKLAYEHFEQTPDLFTKLFIAIHCGQALSIMGEFNNALPYLEEGINTREITKATLLIPAALSIAAKCHFYLGNYQTGNNYIDEAQTLMRQSFQGSKKGIIDLSYIESLLINFNTETFSKEIDLILAQTKKMQQYSYVAWLYFYKAIYHAFYNKSRRGFVGAFAKSNAIAQNLEMLALQENLQSLANLEDSAILATNVNSIFPSGYFNKAQFFYNLTQNVKPISFHIEERTRS